MNFLRPAMMLTTKFIYHIYRFYNHKFQSIVNNSILINDESINLLIQFFQWEICFSKGQLPNIKNDPNFAFYSEKILVLFLFITFLYISSINLIIHFFF
jgi:hypothetical protein